MKSKSFFIVIVLSFVFNSCTTDLVSIPTDESLGIAPQKYGEHIGGDIFEVGSFITLKAAPGDVVIKVACEINDKLFKGRIVNSIYDGDICSAIWDYKDLYRICNNCENKCL